jgi:hypothetical protein
MSGRARQAAIAGFAVTLALAPTAAIAHFVLELPASAYPQDPNGNPQFTSPCGVDPGTAPTGATTSFAPGATIDVRIDEIITHPGHYRVAIAVNDEDELPPDPVVTPVGLDPCGSVVVMDPPVFPVLADGVLSHSSPFSGPQTFQVTLPAVSCARCTLQVIEFQTNHSAPCFHYHCAELRLPEPDASAAGLAGVVAIGGLRLGRRAR